MLISAQLPDKSAMLRAKARWDSVAKPLNSLGALEDMVCKIAGITGSENIQLDKKCAIVFCADHGVVKEGVTQTDSSVTALVAESIAEGSANVNLMASVSGAEVFCVDMGMLNPSKNASVICCRQCAGSYNIAEGAAMTRKQAEKAVEYGIDAVKMAKDKGFKIVAVGEMGIGNTTPTSCIASLLLGVSPEAVTGRGAGLSDEGLSKKLAVVRRAIDINKPDASDGIDVLSKVGGYDIAGLVGAFIGGMVHRVPIVIDGVISMAAALLAVRICPACRDFMLASHISREPAGILLANALGFEPVIHAGMALGEGTGAVCLFPLLDAALAVYNGTHTFNTLGMDAYKAQ